MTTPDPFTHREIETLTQSIRDLNGTINQLRQEMAATYVRKDVIEPQLNDMRRDIQSHTEIFTWAARIVVGAVILALLGLVIASGGIPS